MVKEGIIIFVVFFNNLLDILLRFVVLLRVNDLINWWIIFIFVFVREKLDIDGFIKFLKLLLVLGMLFVSVGLIFVKWVLRVLLMLFGFV